MRKRIIKSLSLLLTATMLITLIGVYPAYSRESTGGQKIPVIAPHEEDELLAYACGDTAEDSGVQLYGIDT